MADGAAMNRVDRPNAGALSIDEAIERLENGNWQDGMSVELASGMVVTADGQLGTAGLLQRLRGHARLLAIRDGKLSPPTPLHLRKPVVRPDVKAMLDAVRQSR